MSSPLSRMATGTPTGGPISSWRTSTRAPGTSREISSCSACVRCGVSHLFRPCITIGA